MRPRPVRQSQRYLSDKEIERILQRKYTGRMLNMSCHRPKGAQLDSCPVVLVVWKNPRLGIAVCELIVDARTGRVINDDQGKKCRR